MLSRRKFLSSTAAVSALATVGGELHAQVSDIGRVGYNCLMTGSGLKNL